MVQYKEKRECDYKQEVIASGTIKTLQTCISDCKLNQAWCWWGMLLVNRLITKQDGLLYKY